MKIKKNIIKIIAELKKNYQDNFLSFVFIITSLINSTILRGITVKNIWEIKPLILDLTFLVIISSFSFFIKEKRRIIYFMTLSILTTCICAINAIYYTFYTSFASVSLIATSTQVVDVGDAVVQNVLKLEDFIFLWQPIFLYYIHIRLLKKDYYQNKKLSKKENKAHFLKQLTSGILLTLITFIFVTSVEWGRFGKLWNREYVAMKFGIYTYQINDFFQSLTPKINTLFGYDNAIKEVSEYYATKKELSKNQYTNILKGRNIIMIHAESIQTITMELTFNGQVITPHLNALADEGMFFSNFYSQVGVGTSSDAEFTLSTSLMPSNAGTVFMSYFDREYITIPKLLKEKGYYTFSMHGNTGAFWNRNVMHKNMGYDKFYHKEYYNIDETIGFGGTGLSDKSFFRQSIPYIKEIAQNNCPYYATMIMLSNHTPFDDNELMDEFPTDYKIEENDTIISKPYLEGTTLGNYFRSVHYADQAIGEFINSLDQEGLLENTVIVIYGDHDARLDKKYYNILYNYDPYEDRLKEDDDPGYIKIDDLKSTIDKRVPFIIWTKDEILQEEVTKVTGMIDVLPTLGNMLGINSDYQLGHDIFSIKDNTVVFNDGSFITDDYYYNSQKETIYSIHNKPIDESYIQQKSLYADKIITISNNIINYDLIKNIQKKEESK